MDQLPIRLHPGIDLREFLEKIAKQQFPDGAFVVCGIGSLSNPRLRLAEQNAATVYSGPFELLSLSGSICLDGTHLHAVIGSDSGQVFGGHVVRGNIVRTTAELLLIPLQEWKLTRTFDDQTGFQELTPIQQSQ